VVDDVQEYTGNCYCGSVTVTVDGPPVASAYCHCHSCRKWHAAPVNAWSIWPLIAVRISGETIRSFTNETSRRISCAQCGGGVANIKPAINMIVVYPMVLAGSDLGFEPVCHVHYIERVLDIADGLPKYIELPKQLGGSGATVGEPERSGWCKECR